MVLPMSTLKMDFARKQLEKYGWTDGKGLGKHENGISEALKPKLKRSVTGVGHDPASEFNEHWWTALYDKAAGNVEVQEKNGKTKRIKTKDKNEFVITNSTWKLSRKNKNMDQEDQYSDHFVRTAVLGSGGSKTEKIRGSDSEEEVEKKDVFKMTDEELFAACEGRTAHKGARHGLRALGKLARIAEQEAKLLTQSKYNGYSHAKKTDSVVEEMNLNSDTEVTEIKKKKKKRKRCNSHNIPVNDCVIDSNKAQSIEESMSDKDQSAADDGVTSILVNNENSRKCNKKSFAVKNSLEITNEEEVVISKKKKKRKVKEDSMEFVNIDDAVTNAFDNVSIKKSKKKKLKNVI